MSNNKRKRAVVLALIAFFCGATAFVSVDWKRFGGGFLAFFKHQSEPMPAYADGRLPSGGGTVGGAADAHPGAAPLPQLVALAGRRHPTGVGASSGGHKSDDDLFKYGDPAAGGIPPGSFLVAQNDTAGSGNGGAGMPAPVGGSAAPETAVNPGSGDSGGGGGGVSSPAPAPAGNGGSGDGGILLPTPTPSPAPTPTPPTPPVSPSPPPVSPPTSTPPAPAPTPTQSGTSDQNPGHGGGDLPPVSAVPEASDAAMMGLGALFLAVAATRRRKNDQA